MAEVASQVNEIILSRYLIEHTDDKLEKLDLEEYQKTSITTMTSEATA